MIPYPIPVRRLMAEEDLSRQALAARVGVTPSHLTNTLTGRTSGLPAIRDLGKLLEAARDKMAKDPILRHRINRALAEYAALEPQDLAEKVQGVVAKYLFEWESKS